MLGTPLLFRGLFGIVGLIVGVVAGVYWLPMCFTEQGSPQFRFDNYTSAISSDLSSGLDHVKGAYETSYNYTSDKLDPLWGHVKDGYEASYNYTSSMWGSAKNKLFG